MGIAINPAKILIPKNCEMSSWATIACDQFTSEKEYWDTLTELVKGKPTTLDLVLPEIYLTGDYQDKIDIINKNITEYLNKGIFEELPEGFILIVRSTKMVKRRIGLIGSVDLEKYDFERNGKTEVRATEGTVKDRIPPRLKIRKDAEIELPHIMVLFDDEKKKINEKLFRQRKKFKKIYDFELNMGGGHIEGYFINKTQEIVDMFSKLLDGKRLKKKYGLEDKFLFAVGDGNHSLATAKTHWEEVKKNLTEEEIETHPARFALCEFVNIYDKGIYFEPIYRLVKGVNVNDFIEKYKLEKIGEVKVYYNHTTEKLNGLDPLPQKIAATDKFIKKYIEENGGSVDYIHGIDNLEKIVNKDESYLGIIFEKLDKKELFRSVANKGPFPKKTFSMGEGIEKRYYLEGKRIK